MSAYCEIADVMARAGRVRGALGQSNAPGEPETTLLIEDVSGAVDAALAARGIGVPVTDATALAALRPIVADGTLVLWLGATFPSSSQDTAADKLREEAAKRYDGALAAINAGTSTLVVLLKAEGPETAAGAASSFWQDEPHYDQIEPFEQLATSRSLHPPFRKGQRL